MEGCRQAVPLEEFDTDVFFAEGELTPEAHSYYAVPVVADALHAVYLMPHPSLSKPVDHAGGRYL
jgi:hypothetical protein